MSKNSELTIPTKVLGGALRLVEVIKVSGHNGQKITRCFPIMDNILRSLIGDNTTVSRCIIKVENGEIVTRESEDTFIRVRDIRGDNFLAMVHSILSVQFSPFNIRVILDKGNFAIGGDTYSSRHTLSNVRTSLQRVLLSTISAVGAYGYSIDYSDGVIKLDNGHYITISERDIEYATRYSEDLGFFYTSK